MLRNILLTLGTAALMAGCARTSYTSMDATATAPPKAASTKKPAKTMPAKTPAAKKPGRKPKRNPDKKAAAKPAPKPARKPMPALPEAAGLTNLAVDAKLAASSTQQKWEGEGPLTAVVDRNPNTRWSTAYKDKQMLTFDLGEVRTVSILRLDWEAAAAKHYVVSVSTDGKAWKLAAEQKDGAAKDRIDVIKLDDVKTRFVRLDLEKRATEYGFSLYEVEIWGK